MPHYGAVRLPDGALKEGLDLFEVAKALAQPETVGWLDLEGATQEDIERLEGLFGFHLLALEDAQNPSTRPKIEEYENFLFVVTRAINHAAGEAALDLNTLFVLLNRRVIVTIHDRPMRSVETAIERLRRHPELLREGPDRLLHHLLDHIVDYFFPLLEALEDRIEALEDRVFSQPDQELLTDIFAARKDTIVLRRALGPLREVVANLMSGLPYIDGELRPFFRDVYDHVLRILEELDTDREVLVGLLECYLSQVNNRLSIAMKRLTALATIGLPFTIVSGFFGMNFEMMPWIKEPWGVIAATAVMVAISGSLFSIFRWRDWL